MERLQYILADLVKFLEGVGGNFCELGGPESEFARPKDQRSHETSHETTQQKPEGKREEWACINR